MRIDEAIEILEDLDTTLPQFPPEKRREALRLGIEALEEVARARRLGPPLVGYRLPGETGS